MAIICPTILAQSSEDYVRQIQNVSPFAGRIQVDLMDGEFASPSSVDLDDVWWPSHFTVDVHLMYKDPFPYLEKLLHLQPNMVIIHVETMVHHMHFAAELHKENIKAGLALLPETPVENVEQILHSFDHMLIFSGDLGKFGGKANLDLAVKAKQAKEHHPDLEVGWDGGVSPDNAKILTDAGVDILNVGGFIQKSEDPKNSFDQLVHCIE